MKLDRLFGFVLAGMLGSVISGNALAQNLLSNPGFESGNFSGWTLSGSTAFEGVSTSFATTPNSGSYSAFFGAVNSYNIISQTIATTPGDSYNISFALNDSGGPIDEMYVDWGSSQVIDIQPPNAFNWTEFGVVVSATSDSTTVSFAFRQDPSYFNLDDTSVIDLTKAAQDSEVVNPIINTDPDPGDDGDQKVPDQGLGLWGASASLVGLCAVAGFRRRERTA